MSVRVLEVNGKEREVAVPQDLAGWQALVGGMIEVVPINFTDEVSGLKGKIVLANEEGMMLNLPINKHKQAQWMAKALGLVGGLRGPVLVVNKQDFK